MILSARPPVRLEQVVYLDYTRPTNFRRSLIHEYCSHLITDKSHDYKNNDALARMEQIEEEVIPVDIVDVTVVGVGPICRPWVDDFEPIASILKARPAFNNHRLADGEGVLPAEAGTKFVIRDMAAFACSTSLASLSGALIVFFMRALGAFLFWKLFVLWLCLFGRLRFFLLRRFCLFRLGLRFLFFLLPRPVVVAWFLGVRGDTEDQEEGKREGSCESFHRRLQRKL